MTLEFLRESLRRTNDPADRARAAVVDGMLRDRGADIPLPSNERQGGIKSFSKEEEKALKTEGKAIYTLTGETIQDQKDAGRKFWYITPSEGGKLLVLHSRLSQVAFDPRPNKFFLPKSNNHTLDEQLEMITEYSYRLQKRLGIQTIEAIMGEAPDYTQLAFTHLDATGERLFGEKYDLYFARTKTSTVGSDVADVGGFSADHGLRVDRWHRGSGDDDGFASPLVVPK